MVQLLNNRAQTMAIEQTKNVSIVLESSLGSSLPSNELWGRWEC